MWAANLLEEGVTSVLENGGTRIVGRLRDVLRESCVFIITSAGDVQHSRRRAAIALIDVFGKVPERRHRRKRKTPQRSRERARPIGDGETPELDSGRSLPPPTVPSDSILPSSAFSARRTSK